jgi:hypothetical protein
MDEGKKIIIDRFLTNVKGKRFVDEGYNIKHDGKEGHWLEVQMGINPNGTNESDIFGYEMKNHTSSKTTFGDWSPDISLWTKKVPYPDIPQLDRDNEFLKYFGKPNQKKNGRLSWSGEPVPVINKINSFGQTLIIDSDGNISAVYSYSKDQRPNKEDLIPEHFKIDNLIIAKWLEESISKKLEKKFNDKGWFKCYKDSSGVYSHIGFGGPIEYNFWLNDVRSGTVFFDCGMYAGNPRPYAQWRANNNYWDALIIETYE